MAVGGDGVGGGCRFWAVFAVDRGIGFQGVPGFVGDGRDQEFALFRQVQIVLGVVGQGEDGAGGRAADGPFAPELFQAGVECLALVGDHALAVVAAWPGVLAGFVPGGGLGDRSAVDGTVRGLRSAGRLAITNSIFLRMRNCLYIYSLPAIPASLFAFPLIH